MKNVINLYIGNCLFKGIKRLLFYAVLMVCCGMSVKKVEAAEINVLTDATELMSTETEDDKDVKIDVQSNNGVKTVSNEIDDGNERMPQMNIIGVDDGGCVSDNVIVDVKVSNVPFLYTAVEYVIVRTMNGKSYEEKRPVFTPCGLIDTDTLVFSKEGEYTIDAMMVDGEKNVIKNGRISFCIDKTAPEIAITGVTEGETKSNDIKVKFICEENYYDTATISVKVNRTLNGISDIQELDIFEHDKRVEVREYVFNREGEYEIKMTAKDKVGNKSQEEVIHFILKKDAQNITFSSANDDGAIKSKGEDSLENEVKDEYIEKVAAKTEETDANLENISYNTLDTYSVEVIEVDKTGNKSVPSGGNDEKQPVDADVSRIGRSRMIEAFVTGAFMLAGFGVMTMAGYMYRKRKDS